MQFVNSLIVGDEFRNRVELLAQQFGTVRVDAGPRWQPLARQIDLAAIESPDGAALIFGAPASVLRHAANAADDFGFVTPVAQITRWWQREPSWRDDTTLALWHAGWSPLTVDRLLVSTAAATIEFVIGSARRTPLVAAPAN